MRPDAVIVSRGRSLVVFFPVVIMGDSNTGDIRIGRWMVLWDTVVYDSLLHQEEGKDDWCSSNRQRERERGTVIGIWSSRLICCYCMIDSTLFWINTPYTRTVQSFVLVFYTLFKLSLSPSPLLPSYSSSKSTKLHLRSHNHTAFINIHTVSSRGQKY